MRKVYPLLLLAAILALIMSGCGTSKAGATNQPDPSMSVVITGSAPIDPSPTESPDPQSSPATREPSHPASPSKSDAADPDQTLKQAASDVIDMLRERDLDRLAKVIDPEQGLRFSPYAHIDGKTAPVFKAGDLPGFKDTSKRNWGSYDGSGEAIELSFRDYFEKFVYDRDFAGAPDVSVNKILGKGNVPFNANEVYPDASFVEFHYPGFDKKNEGMDWESLVLVFLPHGAEWKLCAIVHGQWTI